MTVGALRTRGRPRCGGGGSGDRSDGIDLNLNFSRLSEKERNCVESVSEAIF